MTTQSIGALTLLVADYDQAIRFFTEGLGFALLEDTRLDEPGKPGKRWVRVAPAGAPGSALLLARAATRRRITESGLRQRRWRIRGHTSKSQTQNQNFSQ